MKLPKYNIAYNTRDQLKSLAINANERKHENIIDQVLKFRIIIKLVLKLEKLTLSRMM